MTDRRRHDRVLAPQLRCARGNVVDASTRGMRLRVRRPWRVGEQRKLLLRFDDERAAVTAEAVWCRREAPLKHTVGLAFIDLSAPARALIERALDTDDPTAALIPLGVTGREQGCIPPQAA